MFRPNCKRKKYTSIITSIISMLWILIRNTNINWKYNIENKWKLVLLFLFSSDNTFLFTAFVSTTRLRFVTVAVALIATCCKTCTRLAYSFQFLIGYNYSVVFRSPWRPTSCYTNHCAVHTHAQADVLTGKTCSWDKLTYCNWSHQPYSWCQAWWWWIQHTGFL